MYIRLASPSSSWLPQTNVTWSPGLSSAIPSTSLPIRSFGPGRSWRIATDLPARLAASRTRCAVSACSSALPWEKFRRATSIPASIIWTRTSGSREAGPMVATILVRRMGGTDRSGVSDESAVALHDLAVGGQRPARPEVADHVPVDRAVVRPARLGIGAAERQVDRAADLLVEQDRPDRAVDAGVRPDPDLAQPAGAGVGIQRREEVVVAALGAGVDDAALAELELDPGDLDAARARRDREADAALGRVLVRAGEDLAGRHVPLAVRVDPGAARDAEPQVGAVGLDAQLARPAQALDQPRLARAQLAPGGGGVVAVEERGAADELGELGGAHARLLRGGGGRPERAAPAPPQPGLADRRAGACGAGHAAGVHAGERGGVLGRLDRQRRVGALGLGELRRRERVEVGVLRGAPPRLVLAGQRGPQQRPRAALEQLALDGEQQRRRQRRRAHDDLLAGLRVEAVAAQESGERARKTVPTHPAHGASSSGKCSARCSRSTSRIQRRSPAVANRKRASSSFCFVIGSVPAISQRTASRSKRNSTARCHASSRESGEPAAVAAYSRRVAGVIAPRSTSTSPSGERYDDSGAVSVSAAPRRRLRFPISRSRRARAAPRRRP